MGARDTPGGSDLLRLLGQANATGTQPPSGSFKSPWDPQGVGMAATRRLAQQKSSTSSQGGGFSLGSLSGTPIGAVIHAETNGRNIPQQVHDVNTDKGTPATGYLQIIGPTWKRGAALAGVDINKYPDAIRSPLSVQVQVASQIPFKEWGPRTQRMVTEQFPWINKSDTLGAIQQQHITSQGGGQPAPIQVAAQPQQPQPQGGGNIFQAIGGLFGARG